MANTCNNRSKLDLNKLGEHNGVQKNIITLFQPSNIFKRNYIIQNYVKCYEQNNGHNHNVLLLHTLYVKCITKYVFNMLLQILWNSKLYAVKNVSSPNDKLQMFLSNILLSSCVEPHYNQMRMQRSCLKTPPSNKCKRRIQDTGVSIWYAFTDEIFGQSNCRLLNHVTLTYTIYHLTVLLYSLPTRLN
jgi:hypothetical protein